MHMTDEQRYSAVIKELGEVLQEKNTTISCQAWQIDELKEKLEEAGVKICMLMEEIEKLKGGAE